MNPGFRTTPITHITEWSPHLRTLRVELSGVHFEAGQFFQLALPGLGYLEKRSYSASSAPGAPLEFFLSLVPGGQLTPSLFELEVGDAVDVESTPYGFFTLNEVPDCEVLWLISTGTGLGPTISMLRHGAIFERFSKICVVHGVRHRAELAYRKELETFVKDRGLTYVPVVSREPPETSELAGRVTTNYASGDLMRAAGLPLDERSHVLLCGNPLMIEEMTAELKARGLTKHRRREPGHFNFERYW